MEHDTGTGLQTIDIDLTENLIAAPFFHAMRH